VGACSEPVALLLPASPFSSWPCTPGALQKKDDGDSVRTCGHARCRMQQVTSSSLHRVLHAHSDSVRFRERASSPGIAEYTTKGGGNQMYAEYHQGNGERHDSLRFMCASRV
jgi:hypothetical protein